MWCLCKMCCQIACYWLELQPLIILVVNLPQTTTLELHDMDGNLTDIDVKAALEKNANASKEILEYFDAAAYFIASKIEGLTQEQVLNGIKAKMLTEIFPNRSRYDYWATFLDATGKSVSICPAVDHFLITHQGTRLYLEELAVEESESRLGQNVRTFLENVAWKDEMFVFANRAAEGKAQLTEDAKAVLEARLSRDALLVVLSNSSHGKAEDVLKRGGFGNRLKIDGIERGKIGVVGTAKKGIVDPSWKHEGGRFGDFLDLREFHGDQRAILDLRRKLYYGKVAALMKASGARSVWMASDIPELDLLPLASWREFNPTVAMRNNTGSSIESMTAFATLLTGAKISDRLSELTEDLE